MMTTKILFTDLDGTLLDSKKNISEGNLEAIDELIKSGHKFVIATGRPIQSAIKISQRYGWTGEGYYIASYNGGLIYDCSSNEAIIKHPMPRSYVRYIFDEAYKAGLHAHTYDDKYVVSERDNNELALYTKAIMVPPVVVDDAVSYLKEDPVKVIVISRESHEALEAFRSHMLPWCADRVHVAFSNPILLEFSSPLAIKGLAVKFMCEHFNIPIENSVAAGDEENDISMIETAGVGAVMINGTDMAKAAADYITENDNDHDGLSEIIYKFILS